MRPPLERLHDWEQRLSSLIGRNAEREHDYGRWDCLLWPAAAVEAVTGKDFGERRRGRYRSHAGAYRLLKGLGFASPEALLDSLFDAKPVGFAGRGDLVLAAVAEITEGDGITLKTREIPGVVIGDVALLVGELVVDGITLTKGFVRVPRSAWVKAWAVGPHHGGKLSRSLKKRKIGS